MNDFTWFMLGFSTGATLVLVVVFAALRKLERAVNKMREDGDDGART